jgi:phosphatidylinositol phospholipase C, delta
VEECCSDSGTGTTESGTESDTIVAQESKLPRVPRRQSSGQTSKRPKLPKILPVLSDMSIYTKAYKWKNFKLPESMLYNHVFSFSEPKIKELFKNQQTNHQVEKHNLRYLMRVYPGMTRFTSNNFDPTAFWKKGVQMVALNWQKYGTSPFPRLIYAHADYKIWECKFTKHFSKQIINMDTS